MIKFSSKVLMLSLASLLVFSACGTQKDTKVPVIDSISVSALTITVNASDNIGIGGYAVTASSVQPELRSELWKVSKDLEVETYGTYIVWIKDTSGNITQSDPIEVIKDVIAPIITQVKVEDSMMTITATDNVGVTGYLATTSTATPDLDSIYWIRVATFKLDRQGIFYIWVKDATGNLATYGTSYEYNTDRIKIEEMSKTYLHLKWLNEATGTVTIDGVTYDRAALKTKYGDAYRYVEPLTTKEIEDRYAYLVWWAVNLDQTDYYDPYDSRSYEPSNGGLKRYLEIEEAIYDHQVEIWTSMVNSEDPLLNRFNDILNGEYGVGNVAVCTEHALSNFMCSNEIDIAGFPLIDKEFMVRNFTFSYEMTMKFTLEADLPVQYWFMIKND